jgi:hypothetical protein
MRLHLFIVSLSCAAMVACSSMPPVDCRVGADCASGVCLRDGTCGPVTVVDSGQPQDDGGTSVTDAGSPDAGTDAGLNDAGTDAGLMGCQLENDGRIDRDEVFFQPGLRATFKISGQTTFDTAGTAQADGGRRWDFAQNLTGDASRLVETKALSGEWYESKYPDAGYVAELGQGSTLLGVFASTNDALYLQGVVSPMNDSSATEVHYAPWVKVLQFPLTPNAQWSTTTDVSGKYEGKTIGSAMTVGLVFGLPYQQETYTSTVDRVGNANTPYFDFETLRVRTVMVRSTRLYSFNTWTPFLTLRTFTWNAECFGTVATVVSTDDETSTEFTDAAEVRRLSR